MKCRVHVTQTVDEAGTVVLDVDTESVNVSDPDALLQWVRDQVPGSPWESAPKEVGAEVNHIDFHDIEILTSDCTECGDAVPVGENYCLGCVPMDGE